MVLADPEVKRLVHEVSRGLAEKWGQLRQRRLEAMEGYLIDFMDDLVNYPLVRPWRQSLEMFHEHYWQQIGLRLTPDSYQKLAALIEEAVNDPTCYAYGPIQPDATGLPPGRRLEDVVAEGKAVLAASRPIDPTAAIVVTPEPDNVLAATAEGRNQLRLLARKAALLEQKRIGSSDEEVPRYEYFLYDNLLRRARGQTLRTMEEYWTHRNNALDKIALLGESQPPHDTVEVANVAQATSPESGKISAKDGTADSLVVAPTDVTLVGVESSPPAAKGTAAEQFKPHPSNPNISYWVPPDSGLTEADVIRAFQIAAVVRAVRRLIAQLREKQDHPGVLRQFSDAFNPFGDRFRRDMGETSDLWDLEVLLFELEAEWIRKAYDRIQWYVFGIPAGTGLEFAESIVTSGPPHALQEVTVEALLNVAGTAALLKLGGTLLARGGMRLLTSESAAVRILPKGEGSVWDFGWSLRGQKIEQKLGHNVPSGYPGIDRWIPGDVTSIKSMDLRAATYAEPDAILRIGGKYVDELLEFSGSRRGGLFIQPDEIRSRTLRLAVPPQITETQETALQNVIEYGRVKGVTVEIKRVY